MRFFSNIGLIQKISFFILSLFVFSILSQAWAPHAAYALNPGAGSAQTGTTASAPDTGGNGAGANTATGNTGAQKVVGTDKTGKKIGTTGTGDLSNFWTNAGWILAQIVYVFTVGLGSLVAAVAANILNFAVSLSLDSAAYGLDFVSTGWTTVRDVANMAFIFILVYIALKVMFQAHTAGTMGLLAKVLAVALVINFSFFATRVVIDAGNIISVQFYNAVAGGTDVPKVGAGTLWVGTSFGGGVPDLTAKIMNGIQLASAISPDSFKQANTGTGIDFFSSFIAFSFIYIAVGAMLFMLAAAFVTAGVKFLIRIVMLWMAIITAPLALVAWSFQGGGGHGGGHGSGYFGQWLKNLISHAFYPAVFLFILLLISNFMNATDSLGGVGAGFIQQGVANGAANGTQSGNENLAGLIANIGVRLGFVLVMLFLAIRASNYFEVYGSGVAERIGNTFSLGGLAGYRNALGRVGGGLAGGAVSRTVGAKAYNLNKTLTNSRFGQENVIGRTLRKQVLQPVAGASIGGARSFNKIEEDKKTLQKEIKTGLRDIDTHELVHNVAHNGTATDDEKDKLQKLSKRELEHLDEGDAEAIAKFLTEDQKKIIANSDHFTEGTKEAVERNWHEESKSAPLAKTEEIARELQETNDKLGDIRYVINNQTYQLSQLLKTGQKLNKKDLGTVKEAFSQKMDAAKTQREAGQTMLADAIRRKNIGDANTARDMITKAQTVERNTNEALKRIEKATEESGKIPANAAKNRGKGEFTIPDKKP